jgi:hypothetical protein
MTTVLPSSQLRLEARGWVCRGARPDRDWVGHGYTRKTLSVLHGGRLRRLVVHKQRWRGPDGQTVHDRPPRDVGWSRFGLLTVFTAVWTWMNAPRGLHHAEWPWGEERPSRRSVQRWLARLLPDGLRWQQAIRQVVVDHLAPRPLEEEYPTGLPPPGGLVRWKEEAATAVGQLARVLTLLNTAPSLNIPRSTLLVEARRRFLAERHR